MGSIFSPSIPKPDPAIAEARVKAEKAATEKENMIAARAEERRRSAALGFRGTSSLISSPTSTGFGSNTTLGG